MINQRGEKRAEVPYSSQNKDLPVDDEEEDAAELFSVLLLLLGGIGSIKMSSLCEAFSEFLLSRESVKGPPKVRAAGPLSAATVSFTA